MRLARLPQALRDAFASFATLDDLDRIARVAPQTTVARELRALVDARCGDAVGMAAVGAYLGATAAPPTAAAGVGARWRLQHIRARLTECAAHTMSFGLTLRVPPAYRARLGGITVATLLVGPLSTDVNPDAAAAAAAAAASTKSELGEVELRGFRSETSVEPTELARIVDALPLPPAIRAAFVAHPGADEPYHTYGCLPPAALVARVAVLLALFGGAVRLQVGGLPRSPSVDTAEHRAFWRVVGALRRALPTCVAFSMPPDAWHVFSGASATLRAVCPCLETLGEFEYGSSDADDH
jgi:hypothetical protein